MALTHSAVSTVANASTNPVSFAYDASSTPLMVLMLNVTGATNRSGTPTYGGVNMVQVGSTQKAAASPEASAEMWMLAAPNIPSGSNALSIPNSGTVRIDYNVARTAASLAGYTGGLDVAGGGNGTSTNPASSITTKAPNVVVYAIVASGAQTWAPSARTGTQLYDLDMGTVGGGTQYLNKGAAGVQAMNWTFGTSDDWGIVSASFREYPLVIETVTVTEGGAGVALTPLISRPFDAVAITEDVAPEVTGGPSGTIVAQYRGLFRGVFARVFGRVN